jgi:hypothetical protein
MPLDLDRGRAISNYDECGVHLLSAFFCLTERTADDAHLREEIERVLVELFKAQIAASQSNIIQFCRQPPLAG